MLAQLGGSFNGLRAAAPSGYADIATAAILVYLRAASSVIICFITVPRWQVGTLDIHAVVIVIMWRAISR